jgi:hypothetical protein
MGHSRGENTMCPLLPSQRITKEEEAPDSPVVFFGVTGFLFDGNVAQMSNELHLWPLHHVTR